MDVDVVDEVEGLTNYGDSQPAGSEARTRYASRGGDAEVIEDDFVDEDYDNYDDEFEQGPEEWSEEVVDEIGDDFAPSFKSHGKVKMAVNNYEEDIIEEDITM